MMTRAATLAAALSLLLASSAFARNGLPVLHGRSGGRPVRDRRGRRQRNDGVQVQQVASRGTPAPMVLVAGNLEPVSQSRPIKLAAGSNGDMTATLFH